MEKSHNIITFTNIQHEFRVRNKLTCNEYVVADMINVISSSRAYSVNSWTNISRDQMASDIGVSRRALLGLISKLIKLGFVEKEPGSNRLRCTEKWQEVYINNGKKVPTKDAHDGKKVPTKWEESSHKSEIIPYSIRIKDTICAFPRKEDVFEEFWKLYEKPKDKARARKIFMKIKESEYQKIFDAVPAYVRSTPDPQFRRHASTWLNAENWNDEIIFDSTPQQQPSNKTEVKPLENNQW